VAGSSSLARSSSLVGSTLFCQAAGAAAPNMEYAGVLDALSLLARAIPRGDGSNHGFAKMVEITIIIEYWESLKG
jgi:hypothetical protein